MRTALSTLALFVGAVIVSLAFLTILNRSQHAYISDYDHRACLRSRALAASQRSVLLTIYALHTSTNSTKEREALLRSLERIPDFEC